MTVTVHIECRQRLNRPSGLLLFILVIMIKHHIRQIKNSKKKVAD